jgi:hypothetical protein
LPQTENVDLRLNGNALDIKLKKTYAGLVFLNEFSVE